jgi:hypothetical protein
MGQRARIGVEQHLDRPVHTQHATGRV